MCNLTFINIAWFFDSLLNDLNEMRKEVATSYEEDNQIESQGRRRLQNAGLLKPYKYVSEYDERVDEYEGDEDWLEPWDKV
tara:strand:- start:490 stop:732 length:243 start_codon:yes stop_codon:yes gene_type:complete